MRAITLKMVKPKNRSGGAGARKIALVITVVDFDQLSLYSTGTSLFSNLLLLVCVS